MAVMSIRKLGDPILRAKARPVAEFNEETGNILDDMADSLEYHKGAGLAAPQVGIGSALIVVKLGDEFPLIEMANPEIVSCSGEEIDVEGCLSIPNVFGEVMRSAKVEVRYQDRSGRRKVLRASGFMARAVQHELDHLAGVLFIDKVIRYVSGEE